MAVISKFINTLNKLLPLTPTLIANVNLTNVTLAINIDLYYSH